ncbi:hypothetical protein LG943_12930 [Streptomonospora sp. S1-112]|uniref:CRISPR-associated protein n=1 Tax=Streptomonospora mangrovi TaxID=2883123 RepID=A0A9X3SHF0_9ACTN|nr:hypothetical protein [Streptomonospora mangrovi]MDA0565214.1 hypothetical protein [Streptomonospora mangrovi]
MDDADLDRLAARIVADVVAAATAATGSGAYDWWKVLFALYPNSKPTHAKRVRDPAVLAEDVTALLAADGWQGPVRPCVFCGAACTVLWAKSTLPMFDSLRAINTLPPRVAGWPVCRSCRLAVWALPYGAWVTAGSATVLTCEADGVERAFVARHVRRAARIGQLGFEGLASGRGPEAEVLRALRAHADAPAPAVLWTFKNDNQEPWLRVSAIRAGAVGFLHRMPADPDCAAGWSALKRALHRTGSSGEVVLDGATAAARTLFDPDQAPTDRLLDLLWRLSRNDEPSSLRMWRWRALAALYVKEMHAMDPQRLRPVAELIARWIAADSRRGRFNEYRRAAGSAYPLSRLLVEMSARLYRDGHVVGDLTDVTPELLAAGEQGWRTRACLWFEVMAELHRQGVTISESPLEDDTDEEAPTRFDPLADEAEADEDYA